MKKILLVEDETALLNILADRFTEEGFEVVKATNGQQGLSLAQSEKPDLILLDIILPVMDGLSMLKELRLTQKDTPVFLLTNLSDAEKINQSLNLGVYDFLVKNDWKLEDVVNKVKEKLGS